MRVTHEQIKSDLSDAIDVLMHDHKPKEVAGIFLEILSMEHRTHQANTIRALVEILKEYRNASYDQRNESAVQVAEKINELDKVVGLNISYI